MAVATGLVATLALPGYAVNPVANADGVEAAEAMAQLRSTQSQSLTVEAETAQTVSRDQFTATSEEELAAAQAAEAAAARRAELAATYTAYSGPTAQDFLVAPPASYSQSAVVNIGLQYVGTPYQYGGTTPAGFDCSGFTAYVFAQVGIALPHSVSGQASMGTKISRADAVPGDLVVLNDHSHIGIYMGNGAILDAPYPGKTVQARPLWTDAYYIVRIG
ncbi:MAG: C40 family peptidase [Actinomycetes bacterium]